MYGWLLRRFTFYIDARCPSCLLAKIYMNVNKNHRRKQQQIRQLQCWIQKERWLNHYFSILFNQHLPQLNPKGWWIDTLKRNHLAPFGRSRNHHKNSQTKHKHLKTMSVQHLAEIWRQLIPLLHHTCLHSLYPNFNLSAVDNLEVFVSGGALNVM